MKTSICNYFSSVVRACVLVITGGFSWVCQADEAAPDSLIVSSLTPDLSDFGSNTTNPIADGYNSSAPLYSQAADLDMQFNEVRLGGFERHKFSPQLRVRGWQIAEKTYFGQTKVDGKWGLGLLHDRGEMVYGVNHRGIMVMRRF